MGFPKPDAQFTPSHLPSRYLYAKVECHGHHRHHDVSHGERYDEIVCDNPAKQSEKPAIKTLYPGGTVLVEFGISWHISTLS